VNAEEKDLFRSFCILSRSHIRMALDRIGYDDDAHAILIAHFADLLSLCDQYDDIAKWESELEDLDL
jgi:hypothetical protein